MKLLSIIVPCLNEEEAIPFFYDEIIKTKAQFDNEEGDVDFELIFVDDGSTDGTMKVIKDLKEKDDSIHYVSFSRNFGKEAALYAGFVKSKGDYIVCMDADLQDPPALLLDMYRAITVEGYDSAATRRYTRKGEPPIRSFFARMFYKMMGKISKTEFVDGARDYRIMTRKMVDAILAMGEYNRFTKGIYGWVGFNTKWFAYENVERVAGSTKWSFWKLFLYSLEGITAFSTAPLSIATMLGFMFTVVAFVLIVFIVIKTLTVGDPTNGWPSMVCIIVLFAGLQLFSIGILGQYLSKTYLETKNRPIYIARDED